MNDLEEAVMTETKKEEEPFAEEETLNQESVEDSLEAVRRMTEKIELENEELERSFSKNIPPEPKKRPPERTVTVGTISASLSLIVMGIAMMISLFSPGGILAALKIAPIMLVFLGIEIGLAIFITKGAKIRFNRNGITVSLILIVMTLLMSLVSLLYSAVNGEKVHAQARLKNMLSHEIHDKVHSDNIRSVDITLNLYEDVPENYASLNDLGLSDTIDLNIKYSSADMSLYEFADECRIIIDTLSEMPYNFDKISFLADDGINRYSLDISWLYQSEATTAELLPLVNYFGDEIVADIPDLIDE